MRRLSRIFGSLLFVMTFATGAAAQDPDNTLYLDLKDGRVVIQLWPDIAPKHVARIKELARKHFYDGIVFHRVIEGFMAQTGDPTGTGTGGSDKAVSGRVHPGQALPPRHASAWRAASRPTVPTASSSSCSRRDRIWTASTRSGARW